MNIIRVLLFMACGVCLVRAQAPTATPPAATPKTGLGTIAVTPGTKSAFDAQLEKLTRSAWTWETAMGKNTIKFAKDGTCVHTRFNGTFEIQKDDTVVVNLPTRQQVLVFDFSKGEYSGYDTVLKQKITGAQAPTATPPAATPLAATPPAATPKTGLGTIAGTPGTKSAFDAQLQKLTRSAWTWETAMGKNTIKFAKDGTCVHTRFNGTFEIQKDDTVVVNLPTRQQVLVFDFSKGEYSGYDSVLKQKITGKRTYQKL